MVAYSPVDTSNVSPELAEDTPPPIVDEVTPEFILVTIAKHEAVNSRQ